ncbi:PREDICTED: uncharacterized protein LOC108378810 [Rhagoletis zephyria]|uniref:uncharacterized protein LOC108378810 n=1 Tax=Rhagoletis zephyria TaxID=28612 RepID=UPI0008115EE1|nr:PREDICTED: uncharacterized protein LOC108378810 [Rhagoletis zephyria]
MERNSDIAQGHTKGDRVRVEQQWQKLANILNSQGPSKDVNGWKRVRKKLVRNRKEPSGGEVFNRYNLTEAEETLARITGMYTVVQGIPETTSFGLDETVDLQVEVLDLTEEEMMPSTSTRQNSTIIMERFCNALEKINDTLNAIKEDLRHHHNNMEEIFKEK